MIKKLTLIENHVRYANVHVVLATSQIQCLYNNDTRHFLKCHFIKLVYVSLLRK